MKSKYLFLAFAASAALVACQDQELMSNKGQDSANEGVIDATTLSIAVSKDDAATRALWEENEGNYDFFWTKGDGIGVAYIGDAGNEMASQGVTNYFFTTDSLQLASFKKKPGQGRWTGFYGVGEGLADVQTAYTKANGTDLAQDDLGKSQTAKFKTENDYIFTGYYAVYYPFDAKYDKKGFIPVKSPEALVVKSDLKDNLAAAAANTFSYSKPQAFKAGKNVAEFKLNQLSGMIKLNLRNNTAAAIDNAVQKILLVPSQEFIVAGKLNSVDAAPSASVIADAKTASAFEIKFSDAAWNEEFTTAQAISLPQYNKAQAANTTVSVYFPMLPQNGFTGMDVYLINNQGAAIKVTKTANFNIESAAVQPVGIDIKSSKFDTWIAYDEASFKAVATNAPEDAIIEVLKPITLTSAVTVANKVTIQGKDITLGKNGSLTFSAAATVKNTIIANGGTLNSANATFNKLVVNAKKTLILTATAKFAEIENNGTLTLGDGSAAMAIDVVKVTNKGLLEIKNNAAINPTGAAMDNQGEVYQYVGSVIGAKGLTTAEGAIYTCEVVNQTKFDEAVARKATKIVLAASVEIAIPAIGAEEITIQFDKQALLKNEVKNPNGTTTHVTGVVKAIISNDKSGSYPRIDQNLTVKGDITVEEGMYLKVLKNRTVNVDGKVILKKNAKFEREQGGAEDIEAKVNCSGIETGAGAQWIGGQPNY